MAPLLLSLLFGLPWLVPIVCLWPRARRLDAVPRSGAELARERLWQT